jgi:outer membrane biosynthesis protein TonB
MEPTSVSLLKVVAYTVVTALLSLPVSVIGQQQNQTPAQAQQQVEKQKESTAPQPGNVQQPASTEKPEAQPKKSKGATKTEKKQEAKQPAKDEQAKEDEKPKDPMSSGTFSGMKWRSIGPATTSGRVLDIAVNPRNRAQYYVATVGGLFKTSNAGVT